MNSEVRCLKETRLRNLRRYYRKCIEHPDMLDLADELKHEINSLARELQ